jgi:hypothetical protein
LLSAELGEPDNKLDGINVMGNHNQFGFLVFNKGGDVVKTEFDVKGFVLLVFGLGVFILERLD